MTTDPKFIDPAGASTNDILAWDGSKWAPTTPPSGTLLQGIRDTSVANDGTMVITCRMVIGVYSIDGSNNCTVLTPVTDYTVTKTQTFPTSLGNLGSVSHTVTNKTGGTISMGVIVLT